MNRPWLLYVCASTLGAVGTAGAFLHVTHDPISAFIAACFFGAWTCALAAAICAIIGPKPL